MGDQTKITQGKDYDFVKENLISANDRRFACGDGRYNAEQSEGAIRAFGADFGMIMAYAAAVKDQGIYIEADEIVERYFRAKKARFGSSAIMDYHSDENSHKEGKLGCGHIAKASDPNNDGLYGSITHEDVERLFASFTSYEESRLTVLEGEHQEKGVLLVHASGSGIANYSVNSKDEKGNMYFVVDVDRINNFIDSVTQDFSYGLITPVDPELVKENYQKQMTATAKLLNADKLSTFKVALDHKGNFIMEEIKRSKVYPQA